MNIPTIIGGGRILENTRKKYRAITSDETHRCLKALMAEDIGSYMDHQFQKKGCLLIRAEELAQSTGFAVSDIRLEMDKSVKKGEYIGFNGPVAMRRKTYERLKTALPGLIKEALKKDPLKQDIRQEEIKTRLAPALDDDPLERMLSELCDKDILVREGGGFRLTGFSAALSEEQNRIVSIILEHASQTGLVPFSADTIWKKNGKKYGKDKIKKLMAFLRVQNRLVRVNDGRFLSVEALEQIKSKITDVIHEKGLFTIPDCKPVLGYGRTVAIPILEYLDDVGFTVRQEHGRRLKNNDINDKSL
jgi:selenocysteine-specific elongation factor